MEAAHEGLTDVAVLAVTLHLSDIQHVLLSIALDYAVHNIQLHVTAAGEGDIGQGVHAHDLHLLGTLGSHHLEAVGSDGIHKMNGIQQAGIMLRLLIVNQQFAVLADLLTAGDGGQNLKVLGAGGDVDVGTAAGSQGADLVLHLEGTGSVDGDELDALQEAQTLTKGGTQRVIQMAAIL